MPASRITHPNKGSEDDGFQKHEPDQPETCESLLSCRRVNIDTFSFVQIDVRGQCNDRVCVCVWKSV